MNNIKFIEGVEKIVSTSSKYRSILEGNEAQTRWLLIDIMLLDLLGYQREDIIVEYCIDSEDRVSIYDKVDYSVILNNKSKLLIEAKSLGTDLYSKYSQLSSYYCDAYYSSDYSQNELIGVLTDGDLYLFYTDKIVQGIMDKEPFFTIRLSISEEKEILKLREFSKDKLLEKNYLKTVYEKLDYEVEVEEVDFDLVSEYDLAEYYRIDMVERVFNMYENKGINLSIQNVSIRGKLRPITSFRTLYREIVKEINSMEPNLLYELALKEDSSRVDGLITESFCTLNEVSDSIEVKTNKGIVYLPFSRTRKGIIDRIVYVLKHSSLGLFNVTLKLRDI